MINNLILIYTGNGKGKTTAVLGLACRALREKMKVLMVQFMKTEKDSGEATLGEILPGLEVKNFGMGFVFKTQNTINKTQGKKLETRNKEIIKKGLEFAKKAIKSGKYQVIILDEILVAGHLKLLKQTDIIDLMQVFRKGKQKMFLILTGRGCPKNLYKLADLVTEMKEIKHPFQKGIGAIKGIDY